MIQLVEELRERVEEEGIKEPGKIKRFIQATIN